MFTKEMLVELLQQRINSIKDQIEWTEMRRDQLAQLKIQVTDPELITFLDAKIQKLDERLSRLETRLERLEEALEQLLLTELVELDE